MLSKTAAPSFALLTLVLGECSALGCGGASPVDPVDASSPDDSTPATLRGDGDQADAGRTPARDASTTRDARLSSEAEAADDAQVHRDASTRRDAEVSADADTRKDSEVKKDVDVTKDAGPKTAFPYVYYVNTNDTPTYDVSAFAHQGITDVFMRVSRVSGESNYYRTFLPGLRSTFKGDGVTLWAWINGNLDLQSHQIDLATAAGQAVVDEIASDCADIATLGVNVHLDLDYGDSSHNTTLAAAFVAKVRSAAVDVSLSIAVMPDAAGVDNSLAYGQDYTLLAPHVDFLVPMLYAGNYGLSDATLMSAAKSMQALVPGKLVVALQTYESDTNPVALSSSALTAQIDAVKSHANGVALFRYGLSNF
jgi:hypothetical protein